MTTEIGTEKLSDNPCMLERSINVLPDRLFQLFFLPIGLKSSIGNIYYFCNMKKSKNKSLYYGYDIAQKISV